MKRNKIKIKDIKLKTRVFLEELIQYKRLKYLGGQTYKNEEQDQNVECELINEI